MKKAIINDFAKELRDVSIHSVSFGYAEPDDFTFSLDLDQYEGVERTLTSIGCGEYAGIMIQASVARRPYFNVSGGILYEPTGGARKMAQLLEKKFAFVDMDKKLADLGFKEPRR